MSFPLNSDPLQKTYKTGKVFCPDLAKVTGQESISLEACLVNQATRLHGVCPCRRMTMPTRQGYEAFLANPPAQETKPRPKRKPKPKPKGAARATPTPAPSSFPRHIYFRPTGEELRALLCPWLDSAPPQGSYYDLELKVLSCPIFALAWSKTGPNCRTFKFDDTQGRAVPLSLADKERQGFEFSGGVPYIAGLYRLRGLRDIKDAPPPAIDYAHQPVEGTADLLKSKLIASLETLQRGVDYTALVESVHSSWRTCLKREAEEALGKVLTSLADRYLFPPTKRNLAERLDGVQLRPPVANAIDRLVRSTIGRLCKLHDRFAKQQLNAPAPKDKQEVLVWGLVSLFQAHFPNLRAARALHYVTILLRHLEYERDGHWRVFRKLKKRLASPLWGPAPQM